MSEPSRRPLRLLRDDLASHVRPFPRDFSHLARLIAEGRSRKRIRRPGVRTTVTSSPVALVKEDPWQQL